MTAIDTTQENRKLAANQTAVDMPEGTTKEAFKHFVEKVYPTIRPKPNALRVMVSKFKDDKKSHYITEELMADVLETYGYRATKFKYVPKFWDIPD